jgi:hypothetical protein
MKRVLGVHVVMEIAMMLVLIMCLATPVEGRTLTTAEDSASERVASDEGRSEEVSPDGHHSSTGAGTGTGAGAGGGGGGVSNMFHKIGSKLKGSMMGGSALSSEEGEWEGEGGGGAPTAAQVKTDFASLMAREKKKLLGEEREVEVEVEGDEMGATGLELLRRRFEVTTTTSR